MAAGPRPGTTAWPRHRCTRPARWSRHDQRGQGVGNHVFADDPTTAGAQGPAAITKSALRTWITEERMMRVIDVQPRIPSARTCPRPRTGWCCPTRGMTQDEDATEQQRDPEEDVGDRDRMESTQPPKNPAMTPMKPPTSMVKAVAKHRPGSMPWPRKWSGCRRRSLLLSYPNHAVLDGPCLDSVRSHV